MPGDPDQHVGEPTQRINVVQICGGDQALHDSGAPTNLDGNAHCLASTLTSNAPIAPRNNRE
jgi:hypothetical protein